MEQVNRRNEEAATRLCYQWEPIATTLMTIVPDVARATHNGISSLLISTTPPNNRPTDGSSGVPMRR
jgi:hypothetical protein